MAAEFLQLMFAAFFGVTVVVGTVLVMLPEAPVLRVFQPIVAWVNRIIAQSFPLKEDGQPPNQPKPMVSVISKPVVRIAA